MFVPPDIILIISRFVRQVYQLLLDRFMFFFKYNIIKTAAVYLLRDNLHLVQTHVKQGLFQLHRVYNRNYNLELKKKKYIYTSLKKYSLNSIVALFRIFFIEFAVLLKHHASKNYGDFTSFAERNYCVNHLTDHLVPENQIGQFINYYFDYILKFT